MRQHTSENCEAVAWEIVDAMELDDLRQYVADDLYDLMNNDQECFNFNVASLGDSEA